MIAGGIEGVEVVESDVGGGIQLLGAASLFELLMVLKEYLRFLFYDAGFVDGDATQVGEDVDGDVVGTDITGRNTLVWRFAVCTMHIKLGGVV